MALFSGVRPFVVRAADVHQIWDYFVVGMQGREPSIITLWVIPRCFCVHFCLGFCAAWIFPHRSSLASVSGFIEIGSFSAC